jgi:L-alanine-DL-glutamate epimerase-like enolase superfamily enzyme
VVFDYRVKRWIMVEPFIIAGYRYDYIDTIAVTLSDGQGNAGRSEACGVDYLGETIESLTDQLESIRSRVEADIDLNTLQELLPPGGARNALDCALWDLRCQQSKTTIWQQISIVEKPSVATVYTIGLIDPKHAAHLAKQHAQYKTIKVKADASGSLDTLWRIRRARPDAHLVIDANQSWTWELFHKVHDELIELEIAMLEQPLPANADEPLADYFGPIKLAADESIQSCAELQNLVEKYQVVNIKLDKTGGLTEALQLARRARDMGFEIMVGNMCGSSLAMAPAYVVAQLCTIVDIDGPLLQKEDVAHPLVYSAGNVSPSLGGKLWAGI